MRQVKYLISEARENTNTTDSEAITVSLCNRLLNRCQDFIRAFLSSENVESRILTGTYEFTTVNGQDTYELPFDTYAVNSTNALQQKIPNGLYVNYWTIKNISEKNRGTRSGYILNNNNLILSPVPTTPMNLVLSYKKKLPTLATSYGQIITVTPNTSIELDTGYTSLTGVDDFFCVVDFNGNVISRNNVVDQTGDTILMPDTTDVLVGMFVVPGKCASTHCQLPDEFEAPLIMALENLINARLSSVDLPVSKAMSEEMLDQIAKMYAENKGDDMMPPILEYQEWV